MPQDHILSLSVETRVEIVHSFIVTSGHTFKILSGFHLFIDIVERSKPALKITEDVNTTGLIGSGTATLICLKVVGHSGVNLTVK